MLEFDAAGNLVNHWGGPGQGFEWPESNHGITVDYKSNVWIGGNGQKDAQVLKFTRDGKFLLQIGHQGKNGGSNDLANLGRPAKIFVDRAANEAYIADGYGNKRVIVYDADSGQYKRHWGAYGNKPDDTNAGPYNPSAPPPQQFRSPVHCSEISVDNLVYVCDRVNDRVQVFQKNGTFVKEVFVAKNTLASGSTWDIAFSKDPAQRFIYLADGSNEKVYILERDSLELLDQLRGRRASAGTVLRRTQPRRRLEGQPLHDGDLRRKAPAEVRLQGRRSRHQEGSGNVVAVAFRGLASPGYFFPGAR